MDNDNMGVLNKKEMADKRNKKILVLLIAIAVVVFIVFITLKLMTKEDSIQKVNVSSIITNQETKVLFVGSKNPKNCENCSKITDYLDKENIKYDYYNVDDYSDKEYKEMLKSIDINPDDFGYPAVVYIRNGKLYSNVINLVDTKPVETFIKDYELKNLK